MADDQSSCINRMWPQRVERAYLTYRESIIAMLRSRFSVARVEDALHEVVARWLKGQPASPAVAEVMLQPAYICASVRRQLAHDEAVDRRHANSTHRALMRGALTHRIDAARGSDPAHLEGPTLSEEQLIEELARLPEPQLEALWAFATENVRSRHAARALGCAEGLLFVRRHRALESIRVHREQRAFIDRMHEGRVRRSDPDSGAIRRTPSQLGVTS